MPTEETISVSLQYHLSKKIISYINAHTGKIFKYLDYVEHIKALQKVK